MLPRVAALALSYGRLLAAPTPANTGCCVRAARRLTVPKAWFTYFYVVSLAMSGFALGVGAGLQLSPLALAPAAAFTLHSARRVYECLYIHRFSSEARMSLLVFACGLVHYLLSPWVLLPSAAASPAGKGGLQLPPAAGVALLAAGAALFIYASVKQHRLHVQLAALRPDASAETLAALQGLLAAAQTAAAATREGEAASVTSASGGSGRERTTRSRSRARKAPTREEGGDNDDAAAASTKGGRARSGSRKRVTAAAAPAAPTSTSSSFSSSLYALPRGGWFNTLACPHYTAEVLLYAGLVAMTTGADALQAASSVGNAAWPVSLGACEPSASLFAYAPLVAGLAMAVHLSKAVQGAAATLVAARAPLWLAWTAANLAVTAVRTRRWYVAHFGSKREDGVGASSTPVPRWAIFPGLL